MIIGHRRALSIGARLLVPALVQLDQGPAAAAPGIRDLIEIRDVDSLSISPDSKQLAFRTVAASIGRNSYDLEWQSVALGSGEVRSIGSAGDPIYVDPGLIEEQSPLWSPDGGSIIFRALVDGAIGVWKAASGGGPRTPLIVRDEDVESLALGADGRSLTYSVGPSRDEIERAEQSEKDSGILVDGSVDLAQNLFRGGSVNGRMSSQRLVGYWFVRAGLLWRYPRQKRSFDLESGADEPLGKPQAVPAFVPPPVSDSATARSGSGENARATWDGSSGSVSATLQGRSGPVRCSDPLCSSGRVSALAWRPGTRQLVITFTDRNRRQSLYLWDVPANALHLLVEGDGLLSGDRRGTSPCALSASRAYCVAASAASPPRLVAIDLDGGHSAVLYDPNELWRQTYAPRVEQLRWKTAEGASVAGTLLTPAGSSQHPAPLFINYYSCDGFLRGGEGDEWPIPSLLESGFAVACVNAAPFTGPQDGVATYQTGLEAVRALINLLEHRGLIDRNKVAMGGFSFGSEVATWVALHSNLLASLSIASAQSDPTGYWFDAIGATDRTKMIRKVWGLGTPEETPGRWKQVSPALNAERIRAPILLQLPEQEARRIPEFYGRLTGSLTPAELYAYPDEDHLKVQPRHRLAVNERNLDWFRYWLQDYRDPDSRKAAQYVRWDKMRANWAAGLTPSTIEAKARAKPSR
ncbi:MAG TPA: Atxe2 family lasso peptide isopeptidase [Sphingomicrobium sp.]|jgi:dipeptidyl aminopeptidase/acylaminoacyl peptidase|nr:Atxe2 family lasso peptide isopeptidase [Sphingomicrobium sp.]